LIFSTLTLEYSEINTNFLTFNNIWLETDDNKYVEKAFVNLFRDYIPFIN